MRCCLRSDGVPKSYCNANALEICTIVGAAATLIVAGPGTGKTLVRPEIDAEQLAQALLGLAKEQAGWIGASSGDRHPTRPHSAQCY